MHAIEADRVSRKFGRRKAVDNLSLTIHPGEVVGFIGLNGAGKTTTLQMLSGYMHPDSGSVQIFGCDTRAREFSAYTTVGMLPEDREIRVTETAWENLMQAAEHCYVPKRDALRRGRELLLLLGLSDRADEPVREFSKGMKQRLAIAMSVINYPLLLVLDEPTSGLDVESVLLIRDVVREFKRRGVTILLTTHALEEADTLCDRVAILHEGRLAAFDTPASLRESVPYEPILEVTLLPNAPSVIDDLRKIPGITVVSHVGARYQIRYTDLPWTLESLATYSRQSNRKIATLRMLTPGIEDVFCHVTETELRPRPEASIRWIVPAEASREAVK